MKGSYRVPTGSSRCPKRESESPSIPSRMNRLFSAMPSSMCCPRGEAAHAWNEATDSSRKVSACSRAENTPRRLTHPPRLVETVTSGEVVTTRSANSLRARPMEARIRPKHSWVESRSPRGTGNASGTATAGTS